MEIRNCLLTDALEHSGTLWRMSACHIECEAKVAAWPAGNLVEETVTSDRSDYGELKVKCLNG